jgi:hypothetical protein
MTTESLFFQNAHGHGVDPSKFVRERALERMLPSWLWVRVISA